MIFNLSQGGVSTLAVTAPTGASITASCQGYDVTGTGTCTLELPIIGTWTVTCVYDGVTKSTTQEVTSYGASYSATFTYTATLTVTTFPGATVGITNTTTSYTDSKEATGGTATFTIPAGQLGTYSITSTYSSWSGSATANVSEYDASYSATVDLSVCDFTFTVGGVTYTFTKDSTTGSNGDYYFYKSGANWEFYMKNSGTLSFTAATVIDLFLLGGGNNGVNATGYNTCPGGDGGKRRTVSNITRSGNNTVTVGSAGNDSSLYSYSSSSGTASKGSAASSQSAGENGGYCFNDSSAKGPDGNSRLVGAGGGHGAYSQTNGQSQGTWKTDKTNGGTYGAGNGGESKIDGSTWWCDNGGDAAQDSYGCGGGGAGVYYHTEISTRHGKGNPGSGSKGLVAIRNKR